MGANSSGDIFIAFSTANPGVARPSGVSRAEMLANDQITPLFEGTVHATEEAIVNALVAAETMSGINDNTVYALPHGRLKKVLADYHRLSVPGT
jgi:L-aminopeptidase/D-esterase-like protein